MNRSPERTCIVCRKKAKKQELIRLVVEEGRFEVDEDHTRRTRGAYVHPSWECWSKMNQPSRWERALREEPGSISQTEITRVMEQMRTKLACRK